MLKHVLPRISTNQTASCRIWCSFYLSSLLTHALSTPSSQRTCHASSRCQVSSVTLRSDAAVRPKWYVVEELTHIVYEQRRVPSQSLSHTCAEHCFGSFRKTVAMQWVCKAIHGDAAFADCAVEAELHIQGSLCCELKRQDLVYLGFSAVPK